MKIINGRYVGNLIDQTSRIFQIITYDGDVFLSNVENAQEIIKSGECKSIKHYFNNKFVPIGKDDVLLMLN